MTNQTHTEPMTPKQKQYLRDLFETREIDPQAKARGLAKLAGGKFDKELASRSIDYLLGKPKVTTTVVYKTEKVIDGPGFYRGGSGTVYAGLTREGYQFPLWRRVVEGLPTRTQKIKFWLVSADVEIGGHKMTEKEVAEYGKLIGVCVCCGRTLTDPDSISLGLGPICRNKYAGLFA